MESASGATKLAMKTCDICQNEFRSRGFASHHAKCKKEAETRGALQRLARLEQEKGYGFIALAGAANLPQVTQPLARPQVNSRQRQPRRSVPEGSQAHEPVAPDATYPEYDAPSGSPPSSVDEGVFVGLSPEPMASLPHSMQAAAEANAMHRDLGRPPVADDVCVEPHPRSHQDTRFYSYEGYTETLLASNSTPTPAVDEHGHQPWFPFRTEDDYDLAQWMQDSKLNKPQINSLLKLVRRIRDRPKSEFNLVDETHVSSLWEIARDMYQTALVKTPLPVEYEDQTIEFELWYRPIRDWMCELLDNREIVSQFHWHSVRLSRHDGSKFVRFYTEPWTANSWWKVEDELPEGAVPFNLVLYADKTKLSSFGTHKGYPVYVRCANLPSSVRNGKGLAGGRLVGWLPIVPEDADKSGKKQFVDFKRVVWHRSFRKILESIMGFTKTGFMHDCGDMITRLIVPIVLILSADFEEMCMMAATRGINSDFPCPVCLVPNAELSNLSGKFDLRTTEAMQKVYQDAQEATTVAERDAILKSVSLRNVDNTFWSLKHTDVYSALSWDRLHSFHSGVFKHLLDVFLDLYKDLPRRIVAPIEANLVAIPRWRDLNHFSEISKFKDFSDGRKYEDLSKVLVFAAQAAMTPETTIIGYQLLKWMRSYVEMDMYSSLRSHSATTIAMGQAELKVFEHEMNIYRQLVQPDDLGDDEESPQRLKDWNFPKIHTQTHMFSDIMNKGVTVNFNTKFNENMHGDSKDFYELTNFRDVSKIIIRLTANQVAGLIIQDRVNAHQRAANLSASDPEPLEDTLSTSSSDGGLSRFTIGSAQLCKLSTVSTVIAKGYYPSVQNLHRKIATRLAIELRQPINAIRLDPDSPVTFCRYIKINYISREDSQIATDILRMNANFQGQERYDCALIAVANGFMVARLLGILVLEYAGRKFTLALIIPFDEPLTGTSPAIRKRDKDLRFTRIRSRPQSKSAVVPVNAIVRGVLTVPDFQCQYGDEHIIMDVVDADLWLRMREHGLSSLLRTKTNV